MVHVKISIIYYVILSQHKCTHICLIEFWVSANNLKDKDRFVWEFGKGVDEDDCHSYKWDNHTWDEGEPSKGHCALIKSENDKILLKSGDCEKEIHPFICESMNKLVFM